MLRRILSLIPLFLPFVAYAIYVFIGRKKPNGPSWYDAPWVTLSIIGLGFFIATLVGMTFFEGVKPGTRYEPARIEGGKIVPSRDR